MISYQTNLTSITIFFILANLIPFIRAQTFCPNIASYTNNSLYQANLNTLLSTLFTNIDNNGFYSSTVGQKSNRVHGYALCRGDTQLDFCRSCVQKATYDILQACPSDRQGIIWSEYCMLRYSYAPVLKSLDMNQYECLLNTQNITDFGTFMYDVGTLLGTLTGKASNSGSSLRKVAATSRTTFRSMTIFGMVQCTPDLSRDECSSCLEGFVQDLQRISGGGGFPVGARVLMGSCNLRYEIQPFYNQTRLDELATPMFSQTGNMIIVIVTATVVAGLIIIFLSYVRIMKIKKTKEATQELAPSLLEGNAVDEVSIFGSLRYDFGIFKAATNDFSEANKLGQGGFGAVYKGILPNGQEIAVKRLSIGSHQGDLEFKNEVMLLVKLQHRNLVRLLGYSREGPEKLLVYEFVQNASLDIFIFDTTKRSFLDWDMRYKIIGGIARGILYLHEDSRLTIIHRDLKASNVLLDGNMNPKIADFGMARLFVPDETQGSTNRIVGTYGYMAPEYAMHGEFSVKSDVFSFGVLLLEVISGQKNNCFRHGVTKGDLISSAWDNWCQGTAENLVDPLLRVGSSVPRDILRCIHIGLLCVQENAVNRPTMASVITMLNSSSITLPVASHPAFFVHNRYDSKAFPLKEFSWGEESSNRLSNINGAESISQNDITISEFQAR